MANRPAPIRKAEIERAVKGVITTSLRPIVWLGGWLYWICWCVVGIAGAWLYYAAFRVRDFLKGRR